MTPDRAGELFLHRQANAVAARHFEDQHAGARLQLRSRRLEEGRRLRCIFQEPPERQQVVAATFDTLFQIVGLHQVDIESLSGKPYGRGAELDPIGLQFVAPAARDEVTAASAHIENAGRTATDKPFVGLQHPIDLRLDDVAHAHFQSVSIDIEDGEILFLLEGRKQCFGRGLRGDDLVVRIDDFSVRSCKEFRRVLEKYKPGDKVQVMWKRGTRVMTGEMTLAEEPKK